MTVPTLEALRLEPASGAAPRHLVILLHGYGSNGADMISLAPHWRAELPDALFLAPNAPEPCPGAPGGYQWWGYEDRRSQELAAGARRAAPALDAFIDAQMAEHRLSEGDVLLVGFSQGTMVALHAGPRRERPLAGIIGYSGALPDPGGLAGWVRSKPPILLVHGSADPVVPESAMHQAKAELQRLGFAVEAHVQPGLGHGVDQHGIALAGKFARKCLGSSPASGGEN